MQATSDEFLAAVAPLLADLDTVSLGLLRVTFEPVGAETRAVLSERDGSGTGVWLSAGLTVAQGTVRLADEYGEVFSEAAWAVSGDGTWPHCPSHPDGAPMQPGLTDGVAVWVCPHDGGVIAPIGELARLAGGGPRR